MKPEERQSYKRACERVLDRFNIPKPYAHNAITSTLEMPDKERFTVWLAETSHYAFSELERDRPDFRVMLRCYGQAREYIGRLGGFAPYQLDGETTALQNFLENKVSPR